MIANISKTKEILNKYNLNAKKQLGQNFLVDGNIIKRIVNEANVDKKTGVLEIGPGIGALTEELVINSQKVLCYEKDSDMVKILLDNLHQDNLKIVEGDFLKVDLDNDLHYFDDCEKVKVISNLPYYITTPIIIKLLEDNNRITDFYFMVQKEVGMRLTGKPKSKDYGSLSVLIDFQANAEMCFMVKKTCFYPSPNVDSCVIHLEKADKNFPIEDKKDFLQFVQKIFALRRKTLVNNLTVGYNLDKEEVKTFLSNLNYKETVRSEELDVREIVKLYQEFLLTKKNK